MGENILMIGLGAIGSEVLRQLDDNNDILIRQILVRPGSNTQPCSGIDQKLDLISSIDELDFIPDFVWLIFKILFLFILFSLVKAIVPRYRYDQLMKLGWKIFLPMSLFWVVITA